MNYLIFNKKNTNDVALWWKSNAAGLTDNLDDAGRYSKEDADSFCASSLGDDVAVEESAAYKLATRTIVVIGDGANVRLRYPDPNFNLDKAILDRGLRQLDQHFKRAERSVRSLSSGGRLFARLMFVPALLLSVGMTYVVLHGLGSGEIKEIHKYGSAIVHRTTQADLYWASVAYHSVLCAFTWFVLRATFRGSGWFRGPR